MSSSMDLDKCEVARALDISDLVTSIGLLEWYKLGCGVVLVARPLKGLGPGLVSEPVADD